MFASEIEYAERNTAPEKRHGMHEKFLRLSQVLRLCKDFIQPNNIDVFNGDAVARPGDSALEWCDEAKQLRAELSAIKQSTCSSEPEHYPYPSKIEYLRAQANQIRNEHGYDKAAQSLEEFANLLSPPIAHSEPVAWQVRSKWLRKDVGWGVWMDCTREQYEHWKTASTDVWQYEVRELVAANSHPAALAEPITAQYIFDHIKHGDETHQHWLSCKLHQILPAQSPQPIPATLQKCERCGDSGLVTIFNYDGNGSDADDQPCPDCKE